MYKNVSIIILLLAISLRAASLQADTHLHVLGPQSEGSTAILLELWAGTNSAQLVSVNRKENGTYRLPIVLAESLLKNNSITIGVCLPRSYSEGFDVSPISLMDETPYVTDIAGNPMRYSVQKTQRGELDINYISVRESGCVSNQSSQIRIMLNPLGKLQPKVLLGKFNLLVKPE